MGAKLVACSFLLAVLGCSGSEFAEVKGQVKLEGKPLSRAIVTFEPKAGGRPSVATTDKNGFYELEFDAEKKGAKIGKHTVRIEAETAIVDEQGNEKQRPQIVPPRYNEDSTLVEEVKPGENNIDFNLEWGGWRPGQPDVPILCE